LRKFKRKAFFFKNPRWNFSFFQKISWKTCFFCLENASKKESRESLAKVWRKFHWNFLWPSENFHKLSLSIRKFHETFIWPPKVSWNFFSKNEKLHWHLGFYQKKCFRLNFLPKMTFSLICPNDVFFFIETFSQKLTNLSEISHVIPCYSLLCFFVCFQRIAFPPVRFK